MSSTLADILHELAPIDRTVAAFEKGGRACAKTIERLWERLVELEQDVQDDEAMIHDLEAARDDLEEELEELKSAFKRLEEAGLMKAPPI